MATGFMGYNNSPKSFNYKHSFYKHSHQRSNKFNYILSVKRFYSLKSKPQDITNEIDIFNDIGIIPID
jgi:hypothetical protein